MTADHAPDPRALLAQATPRPWGLDPVFEGLIGGDPIGSENEYQQVVVAEWACDPEDAALIVAAVNEYAALLDVAEAADKFGDLDPSLNAALARLSAARETR